MGTKDGPGNSEIDLRLSELSNDSVPYLGEVKEDLTPASKDGSTSGVIPTQTLATMDGSADAATTDETRTETYVPSPQIRALEDRLNALLTRPIDDATSKKTESGVSEDSDPQILQNDSADSSDQLASSVLQLGSLLGSAEQQNVGDESTSPSIGSPKYDTKELSSSIQQLGALMGTVSRGDSDAADDHDDLLDELLGDEEEEEQADATGDALPGIPESSSFVPDSSIVEMEAMLEETFDVPIDAAMEQTTVTPKDQVNEESTSALSDFLDAALDDNDDEDEKVLEVIQPQQEITDDSTSRLDDFLDQTLDDDLEALQTKTTPPVQPTKQKTSLSKATKKRASPRTSKPSPSPVLPKVKTTRSRKPVVPRFNPLARRKEESKPRKPAVPRFRGRKKVSKAPDQKPQNPSPKTRTTWKPAVPVFRTPKEKTSSTGRSFLSSTLSSRSKSREQPTKMRDASPNTRASMRRTRRFVSKLTSWTTSRGSKQQTPTVEKTKETPDKVSQKPKPANVSPVITVTPARPKTQYGQSTIPRTPKLSSPPRRRTPNSVSSSRATFGSPAISTAPKPHPDSIARSVGSLTSQCSVTSFVSPRREGIRGSQGNFDPYLHEIKGPCEVCVVFLSDEDKAKLDAAGRHMRVMFTTGGCEDCEVYPRNFDELPARICRHCYGNSHRPVKEIRSPRIRRSIYTPVR